MSHDARKLGSNVKCLAVLAAGVVALAATQAHATLMLNVYDGATLLASISDNGMGDTDSTANEIVYSSPANADFSFSIDIAKSNKPGGATDNLNITSFSARNFSAGVQNLTLVLSDIGFVTPGLPSDPVTLQSTVSGTFTSATVGDNVTFQSFADTTNTQQTTAIPSGSPVQSPLQTFMKMDPSLGVESFGGATTLTQFTPTGAFSMSSVSQFNLSAGSQVQFNGASVVSAVVPEPASLGLFTISGLALVGSRRRRV